MIIKADKVNPTFVQLKEGDGLEILAESTYFNFKYCKCGLT